jgi:hypothetical protein
MGKSYSETCPRLGYMGYIHCSDESFRPWRYFDWGGNLWESHGLLGWHISDYRQTEGEISTNLISRCARVATSVQWVMADGLRFR